VAGQRVGEAAEQERVHGREEKVRDRLPRPRLGGQPQEVGVGRDPAREPLVEPRAPAALQVGEAGEDLGERESVDRA
jgi:hypothetical protein